MATKIYNVKHTDGTENPIKVPRRVFVKDIVDITLIGKRTLEYGREFNENLLHMLESFSCPSDPENTHLPDPNSKLYQILDTPLEGQLWYNSTTECLHIWVGTHWDEFITYNSIHGNSGFINDGEYIPIPTNQFGYYHKIEDCAISVSPYYMNSQIENFECSVDSAGKVTAKYTPIGGVQQVGVATYAILCNGLCYPEPPPVFLLSVTPAETVLNRFESVILTATVSGSVEGHVLTWLQTGGPSVTVNPIDQFTIEVIANASTAGLLEFSFVADPYTDNEQRLSVTVMQLGELGLLTSQFYGLNTIVDELSSIINAEDSSLRVVPPPYEMNGESDSVQPGISFAGGYLTSGLLNYNKYNERMTPMVEPIGGSLKVSLISTNYDTEFERMTPTLELIGGTLKVSLISTNYDTEFERMTPTVELIGGTMIIV